MDNGVTPAQEKIINHAALVLATREVKDRSGITPYPDASVRATYLETAAAVLLDDLQGNLPQKGGMPQEQAMQIAYGSAGEPPLHERIAAQIVARVKEIAAELASSPEFLDEIRGAAGPGGWKLAVLPGSVYAVATEHRSAQDPALAKLRRFLRDYGATPYDSVCSSMVDGAKAMAIDMMVERGAVVMDNMNPALLTTASVSRNVRSQGHVHIRV